MSEDRVSTPGAVHLIVEEGDGGLVARSAPAAELTPVAGMNFAYGTVHEVGTQGVTIARGHVAAGCIVPPHAGENSYVLYVVSGAGTLTLCDVADAVVGRVQFGPGDLIVFPPNARHGWVNGSDDFQWLGVDIPAMGHD